MLRYGQEEFNKALKNGVKEFDNITFDNLKLFKEELEGLRFNNCNLNEVQILKCKLKEIFFENCNIKKCNFSESELDYVEIIATNIEKTDFSKCIVSSWEQYCWSEISFKYCIFKLLRINSGLEIGNCIFEECDFTEANIGCPQFLDCKVMNSNMKNIIINSGISCCDFIKANLENSRLEEMEGSNSFNGSNLKNASLCGREYITLELFKDCNLENCELYDLDPKDTVDYEGGDLFKSDLRYVKWINANLKGCNLKEAIIKEANFNGANLENADLRNVDLENASLENANLRNANLEGANLKGARLKDSNLEGITILEKDYVYLEEYIGRDKIILK